MKTTRMSNTKEKIIKDLEKMHFNSGELCDNKSQQLVTAISESYNNNIQIASMYVILPTLVPCINTKIFNDHMSKMYCVFYTKENEKYVTYEQDLIGFIEHCQEEKKTMMIFLSLEGYGYDKKDKYITHGSCMIIHNNKVYYINSHGGALLWANYFCYEATKTRTNTIKLKEALDIVIMTQIVKYINRNVKEKLLYDSSDKHNYLGSNLQYGDEDGLCFVFPIKLWFNLEKNYKKYTDMLENKELTKMILTCFANSKKLKILVKHGKDIEKVSEKYEDMLGYNKMFYYRTLLECRNELLKKKYLDRI
tara:strand:- start:17542 stop:18462 length:921 start_codon:yes stop_codon:yes gene_type:complete